MRFEINLNKNMGVSHQYVAHLKLTRCDMSIISQFKKELYGHDYLKRVLFPRVGMIALL